MNPAQAPAARPKETIAPAPGLEEAAAPAAPPEKSVTPVARASDVVAPARAIEKPVAPATLPEKAVAPAPGARDVVAPARVIDKPVAPAALPRKAVAPAPRVKPAPDTVTGPHAPWRNLRSFRHLDEVIDAITQTKDSVGPQGAGFAWSRSGQEPAIPITSFEPLKNAVFGEGDAGFDPVALLDAAIGKLPPSVAENANAQKTTMQLEGLWIRFPDTTPDADSTQRSRLGIAVSIALSEPEPGLGPFSLNRVSLKFGDFE